MASIVPPPPPSPLPPQNSAPPPPPPHQTFNFSNRIALFIMEIYWCTTSKPIFWGLKGKNTTPFLNGYNFFTHSYFSTFEGILENQRKFYIMWFQYGSNGCLNTLKREQIFKRNSRYNFLASNVFIGRLASTSTS